MPGEIVPLPLGQPNTGLPLYPILYNAAALVWNGTTFATANTANRNLGAADNFARTSEIGATGTYLYTVPAAVTAFGEYWLAWFRRLGSAGTYAITDTDYGNSYFRVGDTLLDLDAYFLRPRTPGVGDAVVFQNADASERFSIEPAESDGTFAGAVRP